MKRSLLSLLAVVLLTSFGAQAQLKPTLPNIDLGLKVGANFAQLNGESWENGYKANFLGGLLVGLRVKKVGVQVEGYFSQTKYTTTGKDFYDLYDNTEIRFRPTTDSTGQKRFRIGYLNIPVLFQYNVLPMLWVQAGPQYTTMITSIKDMDDFVENPDDLFKKSSVSGVVGLEAKLPFKLIAGARYVFGLSSVNNTNAQGAWQQNVIQLHVGFTFL
jgi:hypothetical protein